MTEITFKSLLVNMGLGEAVTRAESGLCPRCGEKTDHKPFVDELSAKEAAISGFCQPCQDVVFADPEDE